MKDLAKIKEMTDDELDALIDQAYRSQGASLPGDDDYMAHWPYANQHEGLAAFSAANKVREAMVAEIQARYAEDALQPVQFEDMPNSPDMWGTSMLQIVQAEADDRRRMMAREVKAPPVAKSGPSTGAIVALMIAGAIAALVFMAMW